MKSSLGLLSALEAIAQSDSGALTVGAAYLSLISGVGRGAVSERNAPVDPMYEAPVTGQHFLLSQVSLYQTSIAAVIMTDSTKLSIRPASNPESRVGHWTEAERASATHFVTIAHPDDTKTKIGIGAWLGDEPITLRRFDGGGFVESEGKIYDFEVEAVITVDYPFPVSGRPSKSRVITHDSARITWLDVEKMVQILDQNDPYQVDNQITTYM